MRASWDFFLLHLSKHLMGTFSLPHVKRTYKSQGCHSKSSSNHKRVNKIFCLFDFYVDQTLVHITEQEQLVVDANLKVGVQFNSHRVCAMPSKTLVSQRSVLFNQKVTGH